MTLVTPVRTPDDSEEGPIDHTFAAVELPLGSIRPTGWLHDQLRLKADGITGRLEQIWPDVGPNSAWLGGTGEDW